MSLTDLLVSESNGFRDGVVRRLCFTSGLPHGPQSRERGPEAVRTAPGVALQLLRPQRSPHATPF